ncbi:MAG TPA: glycosyltransferase, partial [Acidobacteriaceae bacterium]
MTGLRWGGIALGWVVALLWAKRTAEWLRGMSRLPDLLEEAPAPVRGTVSVIIPARNEGAAVGDGLRSLLASRGVELEVIAVDDRSTDETGAVMNALETEVPEADLRYVAERIEELPEGWLGKPHAM